MEDKFENIIADWIKEVKAEDEMTQKQLQILEASLKLFAEKGYHASSTSEIAKEAGVAEGTIFRHFKSKKDILLTLTAPLFLKFISPYLLKDVKAMLEDSSTNVQTTLENIYKNRLELIENNWDRFRIIFQEATFHPEIKAAVIENIAKPARNMLQLFAEKQIQSGSFRNIPAPTVARSIFSMMLGFIFFKHIAFPEDNAKIDDEQELSIMTDVLLHGLMKKPGC